MEIESSIVGDVVVLRLNGSLRSREDVRSEFRAHLYRGSNKFILNFDNVKSINSIGLSALLEFKYEVEKSNGQLSLCMVRDIVKKLMDVTSVYEAFDIYEDEETALTGFIKGLPLISTNSSVSRHRN